MGQSFGLNQGAGRESGIKFSHVIHRATDSIPGREVVLPGAAGIVKLPFSQSVWRNPIRNDRALIEHARMLHSQGPEDPLLKKVSVTPARHGLDNHAQYEISRIGVLSSCAGYEQ